jgi:large subunit ribosomal protein L10
MPTQEKIEAVAQLKKQIERSTMVVSTQYRGMTVKEMQELRRKMREAGLEVKVVKNTLLRLASEQAGKSGIMDVVEGPTALTISYGDIIEAAKAVTGYAQTAPVAFQLRGGFMDGAVLSADPAEARPARAIHGADAGAAGRFHRPAERPATGTDHAPAVATQ